MTLQSKLKESLLSPQKIREIFDYDAATGVLTWRIRPANCVQIGDVAGCPKGNGYLKTRLGGKGYLNHRIIFAWVNGRWPVDQIDHLNHDRTDNRISNLREINNQGNQRNATLRKDNTSGFVGVYWDGEKNIWRANVRVDNKTIHLGRFTNIQGAIEARQAANVRYRYHEHHGVHNVVS